MLHELWVDADGLDTFCLAGPLGDDARALLALPAELVWTVDAESHYAAMTEYYAFRGLGPYTTTYPDQDRETSAERGWE
ncbi:MAG: hypothetical protein U0R68_14775 [Candidatus Nanopelagicales bacterium]